MRLQPYEDETRQEYATRLIQFYQKATVAEGGDKAKQFQMLLNSFRELGELYDRGQVPPVEWRAA